MSERIEIKVLWRAAQTPAEREAVLREACARGRAHLYDPSKAIAALVKHNEQQEFLARYTAQPDEPTIVLGQDGMEGVKRQAVAVALHRTKGSKVEAARLLKISSGTLWSAAKALTAAMLLLCAIVAGAQPAIPSANLVPVAPVVTNVPKLQVSFFWDHSPDADVKGYRIYWSNTKTNPDWKPFLSVGYTNHARAAITNWPMWFTCTATNAEGGESPFSNVCGVLGHDTRATVWSEVSGGPGQAFHFLAVVTNTPATGQEFYRLGISNYVILKVE